MTNDENNYYELRFAGILKIKDDTPITGMLEINCVDDNGKSGWVTLFTDFSATKINQVKLMVDAFDDGVCPSYLFESLEELQRVEAVRFSVIAIDREKKGLMHIVRKTIETEFVKGGSNVYQVGVMLRHPCLRLENETIHEMLAQAAKEMSSSNESLFFEYSSGDYAELDEIKNGACGKRTYIPLKEARRLLEDQFLGIRAVMEHFSITRWNYTDHRKKHQCLPDLQSHRRDIHINLL